MGGQFTPAKGGLNHWLFQHTQPSRFNGLKQQVNFC
jgi:hypothetical protein